MSFETVISSIFTIAFIATIIRISTPLILPALGGLLSELAGVINIALEGLMLTAAFFGVVIGTFSPQWFPGLPFWVHPWIGAMAGILVAMIVLTSLMPANPHPLFTMSATSSFSNCSTSSRNASNRA